jgi:hypothetical protein
MFSFFENICLHATSIPSFLGKFTPITAEDPKILSPAPDENNNSILNRSVMTINVFGSSHMVSNVPNDTFWAKFRLQFMDLWHIKGPKPTYIWTHVLQSSPYNASVTLFKYD